MAPEIKHTPTAASTISSPTASSVPVMLRVAQLTQRQLVHDRLHVGDGRVPVGDRLAAVGDALAAAFVDTAKTRRQHAAGDFGYEVQAHRDITDLRSRRVRAIRSALQGRQIR